MLSRLVCRTHQSPPVASCFGPYDYLTRSLRSSPITGFPGYYESVRPSALHRYSGLAGFPAWASPLASERLVPAVPHNSLHPLHALSTPVAVRHQAPCGLDSQANHTHLVLTTFEFLTTRLQGFT